MSHIVLFFRHILENEVLEVESFLEGDGVLLEAIHAVDFLGVAAIVQSLVRESPLREGVRANHARRQVIGQRVLRAHVVQLLHVLLGLRLGS